MTFSSTPSRHAHSLLTLATAMIPPAIRRALRRRPLSSLAAASSATALGCASYLEHSADGDPSSSIPRDRYDPDAVARYWERRPLSIAARLANVARRLGPVAAEYAAEFHVKPRWRRATAGDAAEEEDEPDARELEVSLSRKLRSALTTLGPTFVKIGQQLSIRPDLVSPTVLHELQRLCDAVPPFEDELAMKVLAQELALANGGCERTMTTEEATDEILEAFEAMPQLVASASLGQVYKARLRARKESHAADVESEDASTEVAIKIQRPDMLETVSLDLFLLVSYGKIVDKICSVLTNQIPYHETFLNGFSSGAFMELNYVNEAENQTYFRRELHSRFHDSKDSTDWKSKFNVPFFHAGRRNAAEKVIVPKVIDRYTTQRVLVSEWIDGIPLARAPPEQIRDLIPVGVEMFLCQLLDIGRFHADPHPGNLYVTKSKKDGTPTLCLLDFGLVAHVDEGARDNMTQAIVNLLQGDYDALIEDDAKRLGFLPHDTDVTELKPALKTILKEGLVEAGSNLHDRKRNLMHISNELNEVFFRHPFSVPPFFALVSNLGEVTVGAISCGWPNLLIFRRLIYTRSLEVSNRAELQVV
ncbi:hypothetical protein ACHAWF_011945 [Thalassiosira exigua]